MLVTIAFICLLVAPARAFGAGNVHDSSGLFGFNTRHGDIGTLLASLPMSFLSNAGAIKCTRVTIRLISSFRFTLLIIIINYAAGELRDYSQLFDVNSLKNVQEPLLRAGYQSRTLSNLDSLLENLL